MLDSRCRPNCNRKSVDNVQLIIECAALCMDFLNPIRPSTPPQNTTHMILHMTYPIYHTLYGRRVACFPLCFDYQINSMLRPHDRKPRIPVAVYTSEHLRGSSICERASEHFQLASNKQQRAPSMPINARITIQLLHTVSHYLRWIYALYMYRNV